MYIPPPFQVDDPDVAEAFMRRFDFATVVTASPSSGLCASHLPVLVRRDGDRVVIVGHIARMNEHWRLMDSTIPSMIVFHGPHGYISPNWYASGPAVPTWNYAVVHAHGSPVARHDPAFLTGVLDELTERYEGHRKQPWSSAMLPAESYEKLRGAIVAFEMPVSRLEVNFKLGQNRSREDRAGAVSGLESEHNASAQALAVFMRERGGR